ncbi:MAG: hypothetical protein C0412_17675 [Flavobacterium sp.]|nr:hypothetical protein [Flavobacterium sp.]
MPWEIKSMRRIINKILYPIVRLYWFVARPKNFGVKCILQYENQILMVRHTYGHKLWCFPGGGMKKGEIPEEAVRREIREEVNIEMSELISIGQFFTASEYKRDTVYCFESEVKSKDFKINEEEIREAKWFPINNLPSNISRYATEILSIAQAKKYKKCHGGVGIWNI